MTVRVFIHWYAITMSGRGVCTRRQLDRQLVVWEAYNMTEEGGGRVRVCACACAELCVCFYMCVCVCVRVVN